MRARPQPRAGLGGFIRRTFGWDIGGAGETGGAPDAPEDDALTGDTSWAPGDLAECIVSGQWWHSPMPGVLIPVAGPGLGDVYKVKAAEPGRHLQTGNHCLFLRFSAFEGCFDSTCFRKVIPTADKAERADPAFLEDLRRLAPEPEGARP